MPYPSSSHSIQRPPSIRSTSSSLFTHPTSVSTTSARSSAAGSGSVYRLSASGLPRKFRDIQRRSRHELPPETTSADAIHTEMKETINHAGELFLSDIFSQDGWPSTQKKKQMIQEAINQANTVAPTNGNLTILGTRKVLSEVSERISVAIRC